VRRLDEAPKLSSKEENSMKLTVDREMCQGHNRCYAAFPALFEVDDEGKAHVRLEEVPDTMLNDAKLAVDNCPERAITLTA
jgi:ferredoxin